MRFPDEKTARNPLAYLLAQRQAGPPSVMLTEARSFFTGLARSLPARRVRPVTGSSDKGMGG